VLFGWIGGASHPLGPVDIFREHNWDAVDAVGALVYSIHLVPAFVFGVFVWWCAHRERDAAKFDRLSRFWWGFLLLNLLAFAVHIVVPVAPPWYIIEHGFVPPTEPLVGNPGGLARVDVLLGYGHFEGVYANAKYVFGALPSLHVAVPAWVALRTDGRWRGAGMWLFTAVMAFYAVYFAHHYIVDLVAGVGMAIFVHAMLESTRAGDVAVWLGRELRRTLGDPSLTTTTPAEEAT
jgi:hypothetical protein